MLQTWTPSVWTRLANESLTGKNTIEDSYIPWIVEPSDVEISQDFDQDAIVSDLKVIVVQEGTIDSHLIGGTHTNYSVMAAANDLKTSGVALVTNELGVFYMDPELKGVCEYAIFDKPNGMDMKYVAGSDFVGDKLIAAAFNETIVGLDKTEQPLDSVKELKVFKETSGKLNPIFGNSPWFNSFGGKQTYIDELASNVRYLYIVTLPNSWNKYVVLQKFDTKDFKLSCETTITASTDLKLENGRTLDDCYASGLTCQDGKIYSISPRYCSLHAIDPATAEVVKIYELEGLTAPCSPYFKDGKFYVLDYKNDRDYVAQINILSA